MAFRSIPFHHVSPKLLLYAVLEILNFLDPTALDWVIIWLSPPLSLHQIGIALLYPLPLQNFPASQTVVSGDDLYTTSVFSPRHECKSMTDDQRIHHRQRQPRYRQKDVLIIASISLI